VWASIIAKEPKRLEPYAYPEVQDAELVKPFEKFAKEMPIPDFVEGFELDEEDAKAMKKIHPEGEETALEVSAKLCCFEPCTTVRD
jgi:hypothetical protein